MASIYRGRFAPSPTGALHFGSLVAALGSFLEARSQQGEWLLRIEDIDQPRVVPGAADDILLTLEAFGFQWDGAVLYQSTRSEAYRDALRRLQEDGLAYGCDCSRKEIAAAAVAIAEDGAPVYAGRCRFRALTDADARAWRLRLDDVSLHFTDRVQGEIEQRLAQEVGDFVLQRADGLFAYQLAVTVDDAFQGITDIVRGADLLLSTPRQIQLLHYLGHAVPGYAHLPVAVNERGEKWSKQTLAPAVELAKARELLVSALRFLGQSAPDDLESAGLAEIWQWALAHWSLAEVPRQRKIIRSLSAASQD